MVDEVFLAIGFRKHQYASDNLNKTIMKAVVGPKGVSTVKTTETYTDTLVDYDFVKLMKM